MNPPDLPDVLQSASSSPMDYPALLANLGDRDRATLERQLQAYESKLGAAPARRWRSLACALMSLAPTRAKLAGANAMLFYIADGKYYQQVFALQALANGLFAVYARDVLTEAIQAGLLTGHKTSDDGATYHLPDCNEILNIDALNGKTPDQDAFYRDLTGWNRKAIRITLPADASETQVGAARQLCALAATEWT